MRLIIQRVLEAGVKVDGEFISKIGPGICILLGLHKGDTQELAEKWAEKALKLKLWPDMSTITEAEKESNSPKGKGGWRTSVLDNNYEVLVVSNFTLYGILKGNKPDFHSSMSADEAKVIYEKFIEKMGKCYTSEKVKAGQFQTYMNVHIVNDGPVTLCLDADEQVEQNNNKSKGDKKGDKDSSEVGEKEEKKSDENNKNKEKHREKKPNQDKPNQHKQNEKKGKHAQVGDNKKLEGDSEKNEHKKKVEDHTLAHEIKMKEEEKHINKEI